MSRAEVLRAIRDPADISGGTRAAPAATVVLLRDADDGAEVLLLRRDSRLDFAAGIWVFPGGRIDDGDFEPSSEHEDPDALFRAAKRGAVREVEEECGLIVEGDTLVWFAHWTPPAVENLRRYATFFFVAAAPGGAVTVDGGEIRDHLWIRPADALARRDAGEIEVIPPTWMTLNQLAAGGATVEEILADTRAADPEIFVSRFVELATGRVVLWAGDAGYEDGDPLRPGARNRLVMIAGEPWHAERWG